MKAMKYLFVLLAGLLFSAGCTKDLTETERGGGQQTGKKVTVALQLHVPKPEAPIIKSQSRAAGEDFVVESDDAAHERATRSDGTTKLYNLWVFQFNADGSINGVPHKVSDEATAINDMVLLDVPLNVAKDQTLYLLALGRQIKADLTSVSSFDDVQELSFSYTATQGGITRSLITSEDDMPFAGYVRGVTVVEVDTGENRGQIEYNSPDGFTGGIGIRRLMSKITLRYKFEVSGYKIDGLRLLNANSTIRITNPATNDDTDNYVTLEGTISPVDGDGFYSVTWFVAQNQQGEKDIRTESDRFYKLLENGKYLGEAPVNATHIEAWAYSINNPDFYAIYQMYVGKNNTSNFDVTSNTLYNLRTTINTDVESAKNDGRVRSFTAAQNIFTRCSGFLKTEGQSDPASGLSYDLDSHYDQRPLIIQAKGRIVTVGIYTDKECTQLADPKTSWLKLSSSENYTAAYNNTLEPLTTFIRTDIIQLPTQLRFYLYNDEYIYDESGTIPNNEDVTKKRRIYIRAETTTEGVTEGTIKRNSIIYYFDQRPPIYIGRYGGKQTNGQYTEGLCMDQMNEYATLYTQTGSTSWNGMHRGYADQFVNTNPLYNGVNDPTNGWLATVQLAMNPGNQTVNHKKGGGTVNLKNPLKRPDGNPVLYQYTYYNTYAARYCYDRNRDLDGDGILQDGEIKWYMPAIYQLFGYWTTMNDSTLRTYNTIPASTFFGSSSTPNNHYTPTFSTSGVCSYDQNSGDNGYLKVRCVRNVSIQSK